MISPKVPTLLGLLSLGLSLTPFLASSESCLSNNQVDRATWKLAACPNTNCDDGVACAPKVWAGFGVSYHYCGCGPASDPSHHPICHAYTVWQPPIQGQPGRWMPGCTFEDFHNCPAEKPRCDPEPEVAVARCICQPEPGTPW